jgi:hypothetical protein
MAQDVEEDVGHAEETAGGDADEVLLLAGAGIAIVFGLAVVFDYRQLAQLGVGLVGSFTSPVTSTGNGLGQLISSFFNALSNKVSSWL